MQFGCFVQLEGLRGKNEGLVHISEVTLAKQNFLFLNFHGREQNISAQSQSALEVTALIYRGDYINYELFC